MEEQGINDKTKNKKATSIATIFFSERAFMDDMVKCFGLEE